MPGHFTHVYTARLLADWLGESKSFNPLDVGEGVQPLLGGLQGLDPGRCSLIMKKWPIFTNIGAVGPDLFFFSQDYASGPLAEFEFEDDILMLGMAVYYWIDKAKDEEWEPLLLILAEVDATFARIVRILIKLKKIWDDFVAAWDATVGPIVDAATQVLDDLTGGLLSAFGDALTELVTAIKQVAEEELITFTDIFSWFSLKMRGGFDEQSFLWSDMLHYRKTTTMARNLFLEAERQFAEDGDTDKLEQFQAFALGWVAHLGTDTIDHSFVNEQCGGPFRTHWQRHHLIENHIDAWNYREAGVGGALPTDDLAATELYPDLSRSAFVYAVALDDEHPNGFERPTSLPDDRAKAKDAVDVDGFMPDWLAEGIVRALIATYHVDGEPQPANLGGGVFQSGIGGFKGALQAILDTAGIHLDRPIDDVIKAVAPDPGFDVPYGYPLPWEVQTSYRFMTSFYRLSFWGGFDLDKPKEPEIIIWPPASDFTDIASAPDFSGPSSGDPLQDVCSAIKSFLDWLVHEAEAIAKLIGDLVKALVSPGTYPIRWALYQLAMWAWDIVTTTHEIMAHTGFVIPHGELVKDGELAQPNEIDHALITLGSTVDGAFLQALGDATDPFGNLDRDPGLIVEPTNPRNLLTPFLPVRPAQNKDSDPNEYQRPWAYPLISRRDDKSLYVTPTELSDVEEELRRLGLWERYGEWVKKAVGDAKGRALTGPYPTGARPDGVFFRTDRQIAPGARSAYEVALSPAMTDAVNELLIGRDGATDHSPLGDAIPFAAYLIGRVLDKDERPVPDFNLDADRGYGYRCWDWIRGDVQGENFRHQSYLKPERESEGGDDWHGAVERPLSSAIVADDPTQWKLLLHYTEVQTGGEAGGPVNHGPLDHGAFDHGPLDGGIGLAKVHGIAAEPVMLPQAAEQPAAGAKAAPRRRRVSRKEVG
ncbi:hypothetical protein [Microbacterium deminutum]|uniref:Phospholipase C/D domain-containing protein n=1 Tax=Microbacterium deminutum TaxID=344164 RepID=A0ABP5C5H8_9MICO